MTPLGARLRSAVFAHHDSPCPLTPELLGSLILSFPPSPYNLLAQDETCRNLAVTPWPVATCFPLLSCCASLLFEALICLWFMFALNSLHRLLLQCRTTTVLRKNSSLVYKPHILMCQNVFPCSNSNISVKFT